MVHANCQAEPLAELLAFSPAFNEAWDLRHYTNYTREAIPQADLDTCGVFLYQQLGLEWDTVSSEALLARVNKRAATICMPNIFFKGYWPFWTSKSPIDFGDSLLDKLIDSGAQKPEILKIYYYGNLEKFVDIKSIAHSSLAMEAEKDAHSPLKIYPVLQKLWNRKHLFYTCNHPGKLLLVHMAEEFLKYLGLPPLSVEATNAYLPEYSNFELPIHPQVAKVLNLPFIGEEHKFNIFGRKLTFIQYISRYIDCRQQGFDADFLGYLQLV